MGNEMETMLKDILTRLDAIGQPQTEAQVRQMIQTHLDGLLADPEFKRKMRFGSGGEPKLIGSKYARWGLDAADVEFLFDLQNALRGQKRVEGSGVYEGPSETLRNAFGAISQAQYFTNDELKEIDRRALDEELRVHRMTRAQWEHAQRAMDTAESGYGSQLIGAQYVSDLWEAARKESRVFGLLDQFEMQAPTVYLPVEVDIPELTYVSENTANNSSNYTTVKTGSNRVTVSAKKFVIHQMWSGEMEEDSIVPFVPFLRRQAQLSLNHYSDSLVLNGDDTNADTGNINLVDANPADTKHYLAFDGIRHAALTDNTGNSASLSGAAPTIDNFVAIYGRMVDATYLHDWGFPTDPNDLVHVVDPWVAAKLMLMDEVVTVDKFGNNATILNGEIAKLFTHPVISSIALAKCNTAGKISNTAENNLYGQIVTFNRRGLKVGWRRRVRLETERIPATDQTRLVYTLRMGLGRFTPTGAASGIEWGDVVYYVGI